MCIKFDSSLTSTKLRKKICSLDRIEALIESHDYYQMMDDVLCASQMKFLIFDAGPYFFQSHELTRPKQITRVISTVKDTLY